MWNVPNFLIAARMAFLSLSLWSPDLGSLERRRSDFSSGESDLREEDEFPDGGCNYIHKGKKSTMEINLY